MTELKDLKWDVNLAVLQKLDADPHYRPDSSKYIPRKTRHITELVEKARSLYIAGNFIESAKVFRQIASYIRDIEFEIELKGDFNPRNTLNDLTGKEWLRHTKSWLVVDGKPSDIPPEIKNHPASFPPSLAKHFIRFFTKQNEWVFDPFMGIGSTIQACMELNRNCWGTELNPKYAEYAQKRLITRQSTLNAYIDKPSDTQNVYRVFAADCRDCARIWTENNFERVKFTLTSPPYWNMLADSRGGVKSTMKQRVGEGFDQIYSENPHDLGNISDYNQYLRELHDTFLQIVQIMVPKGYIMIVLQNVRPRDGIMKPLAWDIAKTLSDTLLLRQEFIWCQDQKFMGIWGYPTTYVSNVHHHYCLVFQVPD